MVTKGRENGWFLSLSLHCMIFLNILSQYNCSVKFSFLLMAGWMVVIILCINVILVCDIPAGTYSNQLIFKNSQLYQIVIMYRAGKFGGENVWRMNRSAKGLLIVTTNFWIVLV